MLRSYGKPGKAANPRQFLILKLYSGKGVYFFIENRYHFKTPWFMKIPALLFGAFIIAFSGCHKPAEKSTDGAITASSVPANKCPEFYYYYGKEKMPLTIAPNLLGIGFKEQLTVSQKLALLKRFPAFEGFLNGNDSISAFNIV